jgi:hypothetical protein
VSDFHHSLLGGRHAAAFFAGDPLDAGDEVRILAFEQLRQHAAEIRAPAPLAHVVVPRVPQPPLLATIGINAARAASCTMMSSNWPITREVMNAITRLTASWQWC